ncbi:MAG: phosphotransferase [Chlamydiales bacterium]
MEEKLHLSDQEMIDALNDGYGIQVVSFSFLPWGADMHASLYRVEAQDRSSYFVKLKRGLKQDTSVQILALLRDAGIEQIIPPIRNIHGGLTHKMQDSTIIVFPFIEGKNAFGHILTNAQWVMLGKVLRCVHAFEVPPSVQRQIRKETYSSKWREIVRDLYIHLERNTSGDEISLRLMKFMQEHKKEILRLVDRAEQLAQKIRTQSPQFVLCHSDIHGGNVLVDGKGAIYIVDWDDPIMAPKERDLMFIGGGVANVWNNPHEEDCFYEGYGKTEINRPILAYYRHERIVEDVAIYGQQLLLTTTGGDARQEMYKQFVDMFDPRGVVDIAFNTDVRLI